MQLLDNKQWVISSFQQVVGFKNLEELTDKLHRFSYRVTKDQALDLPEKIYTTRDVPLTSDQIKHYSMIKDTAVAFLRRRRLGISTRSNDKTTKTTTTTVRVSCYG